MRAKLVILSLAILLALPAYADATWGAKGMREPDTQLDKDGHYMWTDPATSGNKVYFNAFTSQSIGMHAEVGSSINPNFATVGSERQSWNGRMIAMLGTWVDCNGDGFIGWGDNALFEYRADLLVGPYNKGYCPAVSGAPDGTRVGSYAFRPAHNDGVWVREFIPIGPETNNPLTTADANPWDLRDDGARVWVDWGKPGDLPPTTRCYAFAPEGSYHSTGGFLQYVDCFDGFAVTDVFDVVVGAAGDPAGMSFADHPREQFRSRSVLNQPNPWGTSDSGSDASVWDCSQPAVTPHVQPNAVYGFQVSQPNTNVVSTINTGGSIASTVNATATGLDDCNRSNNQGQWETAAANAPYAQETEGIAITNGGGKQQTDFVLAYQEGQRPPFAPAASATNALGRATAKDAGLRATETEGFYLATTVIGEDRNPYTNREALKEGSVFAPVQYVTGYASLTQLSGLELPPGNAVGKYGSANCGTQTTGVWNGWKCDPTQWWPGSCAAGYNCCGAGYSCTALIDGATVDVSVSVGHTYNVRDVDCYDTSTDGLRDADVSYGTLTQTRCG